ncbi:hypothetical protein C8P65_102101 [Capnocytophaga leadbetteri]|uniref:Outer membrane protein assembly factor BamB n=1 Tax=Capnocytophaga leadbetteri TaxID=327575 RepID=A0A2T5XX73_9FLAO|nr:hypothetical protein [Capnocytophaga leadbetteri]PTX08059.1 hypothetical protein C8P65_102101 [Capnocytophaga leadbetteri]
MYRQIEKWENIFSYFYIDGKIYVKTEENCILKELSLTGEVLWESEETEIRYNYVNNDVIIFNLESLEDKYTYDRTFIYDRRKKTLIFKGEIKLILYKEECFDGNILYSSTNENIIIFDILKGEILKKIDKPIIGVTLLVTEKYVIKGYDPYIYIYVKSDYSLLRQQNIQDFFSKEEEIEIYSVHPYKNTFIVIAKRGIVCISQKDGSLIWKSDYYARTMEIVGNLGYVCTGLSLYWVNLDNGEKYGYGRKYDRLPDFEYNGETYWPAGHRVVYHKGLLWYEVFISGYAFILAIDPETGEYKWIHKVETYERVMDIKFYDDKMFLLDSGNTLFIYEEKN